jgi:phage regulator Rha-like protein
MNADHQPHPRNGATPAPGKGDEAAKGNTSKLDSRPAPQALALLQSKDEPRIDSMTMAEQLHQRHDSLFKLVKIHQADFDSLGKVGFQIRASEGSRTGQAVRVALLTEDQAYLLLTYTRNTARTRSLKVKLVQSFSAARRNAQLRQAEYLPEYHALHDRVAELARGSQHQRHVHTNINRLVNKVVGIESGQRSRAPMSILSTVQLVATRAMAGAANHRDGYQRAKAAVQALQVLLPLGDRPKALDLLKCSEVTE